MGLGESSKKNDVSLTTNIPHIFGEDSFDIITAFTSIGKFTVEKIMVFAHAFQLSCSSHCYTCTASIATLEELSGVGRSTVKRTFEDLEKMGIVYSQGRTENGKTKTSARHFNPMFVQLIAEIIQYAKSKNKSRHSIDVIRHARNLFTVFVDNLVNNDAPGGSQSTPEKQGEGVHPEQKAENEGVQTEPQNTGTDPTDQNSKNKKINKPCYKQFPVEFLNRIKNLSEFFKWGEESRRKHLAGLREKRRGTGKEDPAFPASYQGKVYAVPTGFRA